MHGAWWQGWFRQVEAEWQKHWKALGAWRCEMPARRSRAKFRPTTWEVRQAVLGAELGREEDFYTALDEGHDVML